MTAVGNRRLLVLAEFLETGDLREGEFDMRLWTGGVWNEDDKVGDCGTAACALGWATVIPEFQKDGLHLDQYGEPVLNENSSPMLSAMQFFAVTEGDALDLFMPGDADDLKGDHGRKVVAGRIQKLVARLEAQS